MRHLIHISAESSLHLHMEGGEDIADEPDLTRNTRGRYIPILPIVLVIITPDGSSGGFIPNSS